MEDLFEKISNAVFKEDKPKFDAGSQYYTVLINMPDTDILYQKIKREMSNKISDTSIAYVTYEEIETPDALEEKFFQRADRWASTRRNNFVLLKAFTGEEKTADEIKKVIQNIRLLTEDGKISLFFVIPFGKHGIASKINDILKEINLKNDVYIFTERAERFAKEILYESICGTIVMNSYFSYENAKSDRENFVKNKVNQFVGALARDGQEYYRRLQDFIWTTACCHFENTKETFLYTYLYKLVENMSSFDQSIFNDYFRDFDKEMKLSGKVIDALKQAYDKIPCIDSEAAQKEPEEFFNVIQHFRRLFGAGGEHIVQTTIKTTLYFNDRTAKPNYDFYSEKVFEKYIKHRNTLEYPDIRTIIDNYIENLHVQHDDALRNLRDLKVIDEYLEEYLSIYAIKKKIDFWREIKFCIDNDISNKETKIYKMNQKSIKNMETLNDLFEYCKLQKSPSIEKNLDFLPQRSINDIMNLSENTNECEKIRKNYYALDIKEAEVKFDMNSVFTLPVFPNMYMEEQVSLSEMNLPYSIKGIERNGRYLDL